MSFFGGFPFGGGGFHNMGGDDDGTSNLMQMNLKAKSIILNTIKLWVLIRKPHRLRLKKPI